MAFEEKNTPSQSQPCDAGPHPRADFDAQPSAAFTPGPALGQVRMRLVALAHDIERYDIFGGTRSAEAATDIRTYVESVWSVFERSCDDGHRIQCLEEQVEELDFERTALRAECAQLIQALREGWDELTLFASNDSDTSAVCDRMRAAILNAGGEA